MAIEKPEIVRVMVSRGPHCAFPGSSCQLARKYAVSAEICAAESGPTPW